MIFILDLNTRAIDCTTCVVIIFSTAGVLCVEHLGLFRREHAAHICCRNDYTALMIGFAAETFFMALILVLNGVGSHAVRLLLSQGLSQKFLALLFVGLATRYFLSHVRSISKFTSLNN